MRKTEVENKKAPRGGNNITLKHGKITTKIILLQEKDKKSARYRTTSD
jgi:hypothetical protein